MSKSPNRHNKIFVKIEPLAEDVVEMIRTGKINDNMDKKELAKVLREKGWDADEARKIISIESGNMFVDATKGVQYLQESLDSITSVDSMKLPIHYPFYEKSIKYTASHKFTPPENC